MIKFENVTKRYSDDITAIQDINLGIKAGEFISIVGKSGAGKSTLLRLIIREEMPSDGRILIEGIDLSSIRENDLPYLRRKIGFVFQDIKLLPSRTAFENVAYAMEVCGAEREEIEADVPKLLRIVGLEDKGRAFPKELSGGEKQRVAIARALATKPVLFIADEPTGNLDNVNAMEVLDVLKKINDMGTTVMLATHAKELVNKMKKRVVVIEDGRIVSDQEEGKYKL